MCVHHVHYSALDSPTIYNTYVYTYMYGARFQNTYIYLYLYISVYVYKYKHHHMRKWLSELRKFSPVTSKSFILPFSFSPLSSRIIRFYAFAHLLIFIRVICSLAFSCNFSPSIKPSRHLHVSPSEIHCASRHTSCTLPRYLHTHTHTTPPATNCSALHSECV